MLVLPGRPTADGLLWWVLSPQPVPPRIFLRGPGAETAEKRVIALAGAADEPSARRLYVVACDRLQPDASYELEATVGGAGTADSDTARSRTLPTRLGAAPFTIALGSCFCLAKNRGADSSYPPALHAGGLDPIRLRLLLGDQIYMDLSPTSASPLLLDAPDPYQRYLRQLANPALSNFMRRSPTLFMADDHEFWNDYPHRSAWLTWSESKLGGKLGKRMDRAFALFQSALNLSPARALSLASAPPAGSAPAGAGVRLGVSERSFNFEVAPLSFFVLDTRTERTRYDDDSPHFCSSAVFDQLRAWLAGLSGPGVLVLSQPLVERPASAFHRITHTMSDVNLPDYARDYRRLWEALLSAPHDILLLGGDIHWSRVYRIQRPDRPGRTLWEVISSPLALLPGDPPGVGEASGKVEWKGGSARWIRVHASNLPASYMTVSFRSLSGARVSARVRTWGVEPGGARLAGEHQILLG